MEVNLCTSIKKSKWHQSVAISVKVAPNMLRSSAVKCVEYDFPFVSAKKWY